MEIFLELVRLTLDYKRSEVNETIRIDGPEKRNFRIANCVQVEVREIKLVGLQEVFGMRHSSVVSTNSPAGPKGNIVGVGVRSKRLKSTGNLFFTPLLILPLHQIPRHCTQRPVISLQHHFDLIKSLAVPGNFRLLEEFKKGEKGIGDGSCFYSLEGGDDIMMSNWNGTTIGSGYVSLLDVSSIS